ncbi:hypothetical protein ATI53_10795 [Salipiger aestuarii]|uniref:Uncharacterized protein n=2 Tax=Salipiger aestuarii TaxID=568098 RepID=A0A327XRD4_9RHOB|nr:hypothetical protein [Salipiger aestuarii]RAK08539.1 hypothetical protein ATI53_10795 [Salipiger aestuarii]
MGGVPVGLEPVQIASILVKTGMYVSVLLAAGSVINLWLLTALDAVARRRLSGGLQHGLPWRARCSVL